MGYEIRNINRESKDDELKMETRSSKFLNLIIDK